MATKAATVSRARTTPRITKMPGRKVLTVHDRGDPAQTASNALPALYAALYETGAEMLKSGVQLRLEAPRARWLDAHLVPKSQWSVVWAIPVPDTVVDVHPHRREPEVLLERWEYGTVAEILHCGPYGEEDESVRRLHDFITENGYVIAGPHEEEYLTLPNDPEQQTIIRYRIRKKRRTGE